MPADLGDLINDVKDWLNQAKGSSGVNGAAAKLAEPNKSYVATRLTSVEQRITDLRDPNQTPHLVPTDVGDVIGSYTPAATYEFADDCYTLGDQAHREAIKTAPSHQYIGDRLATITSLLPGYRSSAGI